jgi:hypothetical protein
MGRQINYLVLPEDFAALYRAVNRPEPAFWIPRLQPTSKLSVWDGTSQVGGDGWLIREKDLQRMADDEPWWWEPRQSYVVSAGGFGIEMGACFYDGRVLRRERIYFNTMPPVEPEVGHWAGKVIAAARRFLSRPPGSSVYLGPLTLQWINEGKAALTRDGTELAI